MKSFIGRVRTCDAITKKWRGEPAFGDYHGTGSSTRFVVWHRTTKDGHANTQYQPINGYAMSGNQHTIKRALTPIAVSLTLCGVFSGLGIANATPDNDQCTPVPRLQSHEEGPKPGTTCASPGQFRQYVTMTNSYFDVKGTSSSTNETPSDIPLQDTIKESKTKNGPGLRRLLFN